MSVGYADHTDDMKMRETINMLDDEIMIQKDQAGWNDGLNERWVHFKGMKINFYAWVRNKKTLVVDDMECDLTQSSCKIKITKRQ